MHHCQIITITENWQACKHSHPLPIIPVYSPCIMFCVLVLWYVYMPGRGYPHKKIILISHRLRLEPTGPGFHWVWHMHLNNAKNMDTLLQHNDKAVATPPPKKKNKLINAISPSHNTGRFSCILIELQ